MRFVLLYYKSPSFMQGFLYLFKLARINSMLESMIIKPQFLPKWMSELQQKKSCSVNNNENFSLFIILEIQHNMWALLLWCLKSLFCFFYSADELKKINNMRVWMTRGRVNNGIVFIFAWTVPLNPILSIHSAWNDEDVSIILIF